MPWQLAQTATKKTGSKKLTATTPICRIFSSTRVVRMKEVARGAIREWLATQQGSKRQDNRR